MNLKQRIPTVLLCSALIGGVAHLTFASAEETAVAPEIVQTLRGATQLELPARAAGLVIRASKTKRATVAKQVVREAITLNPNCTLAVVGAISFAAPQVAPVVAVTAAKMQPRMLEIITKSAAQAAPTQAQQIVVALLKQYPMRFDRIALAASSGAPKARQAVLAGVVQALPGLKSLVQANTRVRLIGHPEADNGVVTATTLNVTLSQVIAFAHALQSQIGKNGLASGNLPSNPGGKVEPSDIITAILTGQIVIDVPVVNGNPDPSAATIDLQNSPAWHQGGDVNAPLVSGVTSGDLSSAADKTNNATPVKKANTASTQSNTLVTSGQTIEVTGGTAREYSSP